MKLNFTCKNFASFILLFLVVTCANAQQFLWMKNLSAGGTSIQIKDIECDASGNVYITGTFSSTVDFDMGAGVSSLTSSGGNDVFIAKYDFNGNLIGANRFGGTATESVISLKRDTLGNLYLLGSFSLTVDFDPGPGVTNLTSSAGTDMYVLKLNSSGEFVFARSFAGSTNETPKAMAVDDSQNILIAGDFTGTIDLDPGTGTVNESTAGGNDIFICKLNSSGDYAWSKHMGSSVAETTYGIVADNSGNVYVTGTYQVTFDIDPGAGVTNVTSNGSYDIFIDKLDASGNFVWGKSYGSNNNDQATQIVLDGSNNIYLIGGFSSTMIMGSTTLSTNGSFDAFYSKLDNSGNVLWAKSFGSTSTDQCTSISLDSQDNFYLTASFASTMSIPVGGTPTSYTSAGSTDCMVIKCNSTGDIIWGSQMGGTLADNIPGLTINASGNVWVGGYTNSSTFNYTSGSFSLLGTSMSYFGVLPSSQSFPVVEADTVVNTVGVPLNYQILATNNPYSYSIESGSLPTGLSLNSTTGVISGTPTVVDSMNVMIVATNGRGASNSTLLRFVVKDVAPSELSYPESPIFAYINSTFISAMAYVTGNNVSFSISPALPAGLTLNASTGEIAGIATEAIAQTDFTVTATNSGGSTTANFTLTVEDPLTSLNQLKTGLKVYNSAPGKISVSSEKPMSISILNLYGQVVYQGSMSSGTISKSFESGVYLVKLNNQLMKKLVVR